MSPVSLKKLKESVRRQPGDAESWFQLGVAAIDAGDLEEGRNALVQAVTLAPADVNRCLLAGDALAAAGYTADAEEIFRRAAERAPDNADARVRVAGVLLDAGKETAAFEELRRALRADPKHVGAHLLSAVAHEERGAFAEAADHLAAVVSVDIDHLEANRRLAGILGQLGDTGGAVRCWRRVIAQTPDDREALTLTAIALSGDGQHAEAIQVLTDVATRGNDAPAYANLGMALLTARRLDEAARAFSRALELEPNLAEAHCGRGMVLQQQGKWQEAVEAFTTTERLAPENPAGPMNLGLALEALGQDDDALEAYRRAAALAPDDEEIRQALERFSVPQPINDEATRPALVVDKGTAAIAGNLKSFQLLDVLEFLRLQNASGQLVLTSNEGAAVVRLTRGRVTSASAPRVKRLGEMLVERKVITDDQLEAALAQQRGYEDEALARRLLAEGAPAPKVTTVALYQIIAVLDDIMNWPDGAFSFQRGEDREAAEISFDLQEVMLELMKTRDERGR